MPGTPKAYQDEAAELIRIAAGPHQEGDTTKARIRRASRKLGWDIDRIDKIWHKRARRIDAHEMDALRTLQPPQKEKK